MTELDLDLAALRARRRGPDLRAWLRGLRAFDRRAIREPDERDAYWLNVQRRLAESDAAFLRRHTEDQATDPGTQLPAPPTNDP